MQRQIPLPGGLVREPIIVVKPVRAEKAESD